MFSDKISGAVFFKRIELFEVFGKWQVASNNHKNKKLTGIAETELFIRPASTCQHPFPSS
jgi:hypothetical protein